MKRVLMASVLASLAWLASISFAEQSLNRLFFTPEQRAAMDSRRQQGAATVTAGDAPLPTGLVRFDGVLKPGAGPATVWLDGVPVRGGKTPAQVRVGELFDAKTGKPEGGRLSQRSGP